MARVSNDMKIVGNPSTKFIKWMNPTTKTKEKGVTTSGFYYWDKETSMNIGVEFPFTFQYLQDAQGIGGYSDKKGQLFSNEVLDVYETPFDIKCFQDNSELVLKSGFYYTEQKLPASKMTKDDLTVLKKQINTDGKNGTLETIAKKVTGAKKITILYILVGEEIWRMKLEGGNLSAWAEFQKDKNSTKWRGNDQNLQNFICWYDIKEKENPKADKDGVKFYNVPAFKYLKATTEDLDFGEQLYKEKVEPYFKFLLEEPEENLEVISGDY